MGRLLTAIGLIVVALFAAAAIVPFLIDWNGQKALFEREASRRFGVPVVVDGRMELTVLPTPVLSLEGVRLGNGGLDVRIETVRLDLSLPALMRGDVLVTAARIVEPRVTLTLDRTGQVAGAREPIDAAAVQIANLSVEGGQLTIVDTREGGGRLDVDSLSFSGEAQSLQGPFRFEGAGRYDGRRAAFSLTTGRAEGTDVRVRLSVEPSDDPISGEFDGTLRFAEARPVLNGAVKLRGVGARDAAQRETGWRLEGVVEARPNRIHARELRLVPGAEDRMLEFFGGAHLSLGRELRLEAAVALRQLDLDRLAEVGADHPSDVAGVLARLAGLPIASLTAAIDTNLSLEIGSAVLAGGLVQELKLTVETRDGRWRLSSIESRLPGNATLKASGNFGLRGGPLVFHGPVELNVRAPTAFSGWLEGELLRPRPSRPVPSATPVSLTGRLTVAPDRVAIDGFTATVGTATVTGGAELTDERRRFVLRLSAPDVDLEPLVGLGRALAPRTAALDIRQVDAELRADRLRYRSLDIRGLDLALRSGPSGVSAERIAGVANGLTVSGRGRIEPDGAGQIALRISGERIAPALTAIESTFGAHAVLDALRDRSSALGAVAIETALTLRGGERRVSMSGTAGGSTIEASLAADRLDASTEAVTRLSLRMANPRLDVLLGQLGLDASPAPGGPGGIIAVEIERRTGGAHQLVLDAELARTNLSARGAVTLGRADLSNGLAVSLDSPDVAPLLFALGTVVAEPGETIPARLSARLALTERDARLEAIEGMVAGEPVRGTLTIGTNPASRVEGRLDLGEIGLDRVLALAAGPWPSLGTGEIWPSAAFGTRPLPALDGHVSVGVRRLRAERFALDDARFDLRFAETGVSLDQLSGRVAGGRLSGEIAARRLEAGLQMTARLALAEARLEDLVWTRNSRPVATGRLDARLALEGSGRSPSVLIGNLSGQGSLTLSDGEVRGVAIGGFTAGLRAAEAGVDVVEARLAELVRSELDSGALPFARMEAALTVQGGVLRAGNLTLDGAPAAVTGRMGLNLPRWAIDAEATLEGPAARPGQRGPRIALLFTGPLDAPARRIDVRAFVDYLNLRRFEREVERLETLQRDIDQRERLLREMEERERERRSRLQPPEPAPQTPASPPQPTTAPQPTPPTANPTPARPALRPEATETPAAPAAPSPTRAAEAPDEPRRAPERPQTLAPLPPPVVVPAAPGTPGTTGGAPLQLVPQRQP
jgi:hypothetical protein